MEQGKPHTIVLEPPKVDVGPSDCSCVNTSDIEMEIGQRGITWECHAAHASSPLRPRNMAIIPIDDILGQQQECGARINNGFSSRPPRPTTAPNCELPGGDLPETPGCVGAYLGELTCEPGIVNPPKFVSPGGASAEICCEERLDECRHDVFKECLLLRWLHGAELRECEAN